VCEGNAIYAKNTDRDKGDKETEEKVVVVLDTRLLLQATIS